MDCADIKCGSCRKSVVRPLAQRYVCADCPTEVDENGDPTMFGTMGACGGGVVAAQPGGGNGKEHMQSVVAV